MNNTMNRALIQATKETFRQVVGYEVQNSAPEEKNINGTHVDTSVIISFVGAISGAFTLRCS
jgi:chemotaxis protein CheX